MTVRLVKDLSLEDKVVLSGEEEVDSPEEDSKGLSWVDLRAMCVEEEFEQREFICPACEHTGMFRMLLERTDEDDYEVVLPICPECGEQMELFGTAEFEASKEEFLEEWAMRGRTRIETSVTRAGLYPKYIDERGRRDIDLWDKSPGELVLRHARISRGTFGFSWICFRGTGMPIEVPSQHPYEVWGRLSRPLMALSNAARHGNDWESAKTVTYRTIVPTKEGSRVLWERNKLMIQVSQAVLEREDLETFYRYTALQAGRSWLLEKLGKMSWRAVLRVTEENPKVARLIEQKWGVRPEDDKALRRIGESSVLYKARGLLSFQFTAVPDGEDFHSDELVDIERISGRNISHHDIEYIYTTR